MQQHSKTNSSVFKIDWQDWSIVHVIYSFLNFLEVVLALRLIAKLLGANTGNDIVHILYMVTQPLVAPFLAIFPNPERVFIEWGTVVAMLVYALVAHLIVRLLDLE